MEPLSVVSSCSFIRFNTSPVHWRVVLRECSYIGYFNMFFMDINVFSQAYYLDLQRHFLIASTIFFLKIQLLLVSIFI